MTKGPFSSDKLRKSDTSCTMDAASHGSLDKRSKLFVLNGSLVLLETAFSITVDSRDILKIALTTLVTNWTIKWMVCEKELHHASIIINQILLL